MTDMNTTCAIAVLKALKQCNARGLAARQAVFDRVLSEHAGCDEHRVRAEVERLMHTRVR